MIVMIVAIVVDDDDDDGLGLTAADIDGKELGCYHPLMNPPQNLRHANVWGGPMGW